MPFNGGVYQYRVRGNVHTRISSSLHPNPTSSLESERRRRYGQLYVVDSAEATAERLRERPNRGISVELMKLLDRIIRENNVHAQASQTTAEIEKEEMRKAEEEARNNGLDVPVMPSARLTFGLRPGQDRRQYNRSTANEV
ncbi:Protein F33H12.6 [Aphelenchoides avenae]|nr:Protein F33H12.6 [Aphelenchus avenae]